MTSDQAADEHVSPVDARLAALHLSPHKSAHESAHFLRSGASLKDAEECAGLRPGRHEAAAEDADEDAQETMYRAERGRGTHSDRANRAVAEQVLDARTRLMLLKMINRGVFCEMHGCVSTGKEANVYHAVGSASELRACNVPDLIFPATLPPLDRGEALADCAGAAMNQNEVTMNQNEVTMNQNEVTMNQNEATLNQNEAHISSTESMISATDAVKSYASENAQCDTAEEADERHYAIKIYKTTILTFKAREKYVTGEFRFRAGYARSNPRKMVKLWAEKETRNLRRLRAAGVPCPRPLLLRQHVLLMDFVGERCAERGTWVAAPRLRDARITAEAAHGIYMDVVRAMRAMYQDARLVHADLSEYNILLWRNTPVVIDVSQAVEHDHPMALEFLRKDCANIVAFFRVLGVPTLDIRRLFDFVTDIALPAMAALPATPHVPHADAPWFCGTDRLRSSPALEAALAAMHAEARAGECALVTAEDAAAAAVDEGVFCNAFIPRTLDDIIDAERDCGADAGALLYRKLTGLHALECSSDSESVSSSGTQSESDCGSENESDCKSSENEGVRESTDPGDVRAARKENKAAVKAANRERRKTKLPKHIKKRKTRADR